jgi:hypothetical protein
VVGRLKRKDSVPLRSRRVPATREQQQSGSESLRRGSLTETAQNRDNRTTASRLGRREKGSSCCGNQTNMEWKILTRLPDAKGVWENLIIKCDGHGQGRVASISGRQFFFTFFEACSFPWPSNESETPCHFSNPHGGI